LIDAADVDTAATASKVVRRIAGGQITVPTTPSASTDAASKSYADSLSTGVLKAMYQVIGLTNAQDPLLGATSETDGSAMYTAHLQNSTTINIRRFDKDTNTGQYYLVYSTTIGSLSSISNNTLVGMAAVGTYLYVTFRDAGVPVVLLRRLNKADLTGLTSMTFSGTLPDNSTDPKTMYTNGTDLIINSNGTTWYRYTISGTTATNAATVTSLSNPDGAIYDGSKVYFIAGASTLSRYTATGTSEASHSRNLGTIGAAEQQTRGLVNIDSTKLYMVVGYEVHSNTAYANDVLALYPVSKP
jgi:hypothetical protein